MNTTNSATLILISLGIIFFFSKPMYADLSTLLSKKSQYDDAVAKMQTIEEIKKNLNDKIQSLSEEDRSRINTLLPDSAGNIKLISDIDALAAHYGLAIDQISTTAVNDDSASSVSASAPAKNYDSMLVSFSFRSDYSNLKKFLTDLEGSLRLLDIRSIEFSAPDKNGLYNYKVNIQIYWLKASDLKT